ncbi:unnamed protein product [Scytosiphon promiscuus]
MGNITHGAARGLAAPASLALLPRFPAFASTGLLPPAYRHGRSSAKSSSCDRTFASRKRPHPVGGRSSLSRAVGPEVGPPGTAHLPSYRQNSNHDDLYDGHNHGEGNDAVARATLRWVRSTVVGLNLCPWAGGALIGGRMKVLVHPALPAEPAMPFPTAATATAESGDATCASSSSSSTSTSTSTSTSNATEEIPRHSSSHGASDSQLGPRRPEPGQGESGAEANFSGGDAPHSIGEDNEEGLLSPFEGLVEAAARQAGALAALRGEAAANATTLVVARPPLAQDFDEFLEVVDAVDEFLDDAGLRGTVQLATFHPRYRFEGSEEDDPSNYTNRSPYPVLHLLLEDQVSAAVEQIGDPAKVWQRNVETTRKLGVETMRQGVEACLNPEM